MFTKGDINALKEVSNILHLFGKVLGLKANHAKSCIYFGGIIEKELQAII